MLQMQLPACRPSREAASLLEHDAVSCASSTAVNDGMSQEASAKLVEQVEASLHRMMEEQSRLSFRLAEQMQSNQQRQALQDERIQRIEALLTIQGQGIDLVMNELRHCQQFAALSRVPEDNSHPASYVADISIHNGKASAQWANRQYVGNQSEVPNFDAETHSDIDAQFAHFPPTDVTRVLAEPSELQPSKQEEMQTNYPLLSRMLDHHKAVDDDLTSLFSEDAASALGVGTSSSSQPVDFNDLPTGPDGSCTLMIKNIPCRCSKRKLLESITKLGFGQDVRFLHVPSRTGTEGSMGYAFIGFDNKDIASRFAKRVDGFRFNGTNSTKMCSVLPARIQGIKNALENCQRKKGLENMLMLSF
jgi:arsenate reductase-like glutaredoxin family protein